MELQGSLPLRDTDSSMHLIQASEKILWMSTLRMIIFSSPLSSIILWAQSSTGILDRNTFLQQEELFLRIEKFKE